MSHVTVIGNRNIRPIGNIFMENTLDFINFKVLIHIGRKWGMSGVILAGFVTLHTL